MSEDQAREAMRDILAGYPQLAEILESGEIEVLEYFAGWRELAAVTLEPSDESA